MPLRINSDLPNRSMTSHRRAAAAAMAAALLLGPGCGKSKPTAIDAATTRIKLRTSQYAEALKVGMPAALAAFFTTDGELDEPNLAPIVGTAAITQFYAAISNTVQVAAVELAPLRLDIDNAASPPVAHQWGTVLEVAAEPGKAPVTLTGRFVARWRLDRDGEWRLAQLLMQPAPPTQWARL